MRTDRDERQAAVVEWAGRTFGSPALDIRERVARLLEEAIKLAQAEGLPIDTARRLVEHVYTKPPGQPQQEVGGIGVCLLAYCGVVKVSTEDAERLEAERVFAIPAEHFRGRQNAKADAGVAMRVAAGSSTP
jgi:hypothetical protein